MINFDFGPTEEAPVEVPAIDHERLNRLIGVLHKKNDVGEPAYLIALTFDELVELTEFIEENALDSEENMQRLHARLETKITLIEKRS